jgi:hypothetical protein
MGYKKLGIGIGAVAGIVALAGLAFVFTQGSVTPDNPMNNDPQTSPVNNSPEEGPWAQQDRQVKQTISLEDTTGGDVTSGTIHVFEEKPEDSNGNTVWDNQREIEPYYGTSQERDTVSVSSSETTVQYEPGTYYLAIESDSMYTEFVQLEVPDGSNIEESLSEYNQAPGGETYELSNIHNVDFNAFDVGVDQNTTSIETWSDDQTIRPSDGSEYRAWKAVVHTGDVDPTTDSDSDGNHDEGIRKAYVEVSGANMASTDSTTVFNPNNGVDLLGSDDKAEIDLSDVVVSKDSPLTFSTYLLTFETSTSGASDGDEVLTDGENPLDIQLFDQTGTGTSKIDVTA